MVTGYPLVRRTSDTNGQPSQTQEEEMTHISERGGWMVHPLATLMGSPKLGASKRLQKSDLSHSRGPTTETVHRCTITILVVTPRHSDSTVNVSMTRDTHTKT